jgi:hypothetical protein
MQTHAVHTIRTISTMKQSGRMRIVYVRCALSFDIGWHSASVMDQSLLASGLAAHCFNSHCFVHSDLSIHFSPLLTLSEDLFHYY